MCVGGGVGEWVSECMPVFEPPQFKFMSQIYVTTTKNASWMGAVGNLTRESQMNHRFYIKKRL